MKLFSPTAYTHASRIRVFNYYPDSFFILPFDKNEISLLLNLIINLPDLEQYQISRLDFYILDDIHIGYANMTYMGAHGPTNILSFPGDKNLPASIIFSVDAFNRECFLYGQDRREYFIYLIAHASGHIAGLNHGQEMYCLCEKLYQKALDFLPFLETHEPILRQD